MDSDIGEARDTHAYTADGLKVRVRTSGIAGIVQVEQSRRSTTHAHPEYGGAMMRHGLIDGRDRAVEKGSEILEHRVVGRLRQAGLA